jgi:hypothetical protein
VVARLAKVAEATKLPAHLRGGPSAASPLEEGRAFRGLLSRRPPSGLISTNSWALTSWKNPRPHGKDAISRRRSHHSSSVNSTASTGTNQPFGFGRPAFGGDQCRGERSGGRAHRFGGVRGQPRGVGGIGARRRSATKDTGSHREQGRGGTARAGGAAVFVSGAAVPAAERGTNACRSRCCRLQHQSS